MNAPMTLTEADVEAAALDWLAALGWRVAHGPDIAPDAPGAERTSRRCAVWLLPPADPPGRADAGARQRTV